MVLESIMSGRFRPGDRVKEQDFVETLGVSRTPVREALQLLESRRFLQNEPGRGLVVTKLSKQQFLQLYAVREVLEGAAARLATQYALPSEIALMHQILDAFTASRKVEELVRYDVALHRAIAEAARNQYIQEYLSNVAETLSLLQTSTFSVPGRQEIADREHRAIVAAIESRNAEAAETASRFHIQEAQRFRLLMISFD
jgi:DNA-binding GntR family transcriptional regulator